MMRHFLSPLLVLIPASLLCAAEGDPLAVRAWEAGVISIETQWGLHLVVRSDETPDARVSVKADQVVDLASATDHVISRLPNQAKPRWITASKFRADDPNALFVKSIDEHAIEINVDGVCVIVATRQFEASQRSNDNDVDVLVVLDATAEQLTDEPLASLQQSLHPRFVVPLVISDSTTDGGDVVNHNTLAVSASDEHGVPAQTIQLNHTAWKMPDSLASLFDSMEKACSDSQKVFGELSVAQLNFQPANGTHTPRWNAEHMMGRQLQFFSQIYHAIDPEIPVLNLNPKQMPADYQFAHSDWNGAEEARQMQRVSMFCRRFAYLLDGISVEDKAPGSRWPSLRALLVQMDKHYQEHTANTIKKFDLPGWPAE